VAELPLPAFAPLPIANDPMPAAVPPASEYCANATGLDSPSPIAVETPASAHIARFVSLRRQPVSVGWHGGLPRLTAPPDAVPPLPFPLALSCSDTATKAPDARLYIVRHTLFMFLSFLEVR
jgi:hypothetical protein